MCGELPASWRHTTLIKAVRRSESNQKQPDAPAEQQLLTHNNVLTHTRDATQRLGALWSCNALRSGRPRTCLARRPLLSLHQKNWVICKALAGHAQWKEKKARDVRTGLEEDGFLRGPPRGRSGKHGGGGGVLPRDGGCRRAVFECDAARPMSI